MDLIKWRTKWLVLALLFLVVQNDVIGTDDEKTVSEALAKAVVQEKVKKEWNSFRDDQVFVEKGLDPKVVEFKKLDVITLSEIFHYLQYFPLLEDKPTVYHIPVDGEITTLKFELDANNKGRFKVKHLFKGPDPNDPTKTKDLETDLSYIQSIVQEQANTFPEVSSVIKKSMPNIYKDKLNEKGHLAKEIQDSKAQIDNEDVKKAFRQAVEIMASTSILRKDISKLNPPSWLKEMNKEFETSRNALEEKLTNDLKNQETTKLRYELAASFLHTSKEAKEKWQNLVDQNIIVEQRKEFKNGKIEVESVQIKPTNELTLKETFKMLQHFIYIYPGYNHRIGFKMPIGGMDVTIQIQPSPFVRSQLYILTENSEWPDTKAKTKGASYVEMVDQVLSRYPNQGELAHELLNALNANLNNQPDFQTKLEIKNPNGERDVKRTQNVIRHAIEFLAVTTIAEAAIPQEIVKNAFIENIAQTVKNRNRFPERLDMPNLEELGKKGGRSPAMDQVVIHLLKEIERNKGGFQTYFGDDYFPVRKKGGTKLGRIYLHKHGDDEIPSFLIRKRAAEDHDGETFVKKARYACTGSKLRRKRYACSSEEVNDDTMVDEKSIKIHDTKVELEVVDRRDATNRRLLELKITPDELATPKLTRENIMNSKRAEAPKGYTKIHKGLAVHGLVYSALGAIDYFKRGDNVQGGIAVSQSLHTLGGLTGFNEVASKVGKQALRYSALKIAKGLKMEKGLATFSEKVEKFTEKGVGKLMGDIPGVGLAFDIYFIKQDVEALAKLDLNNPEDVKMLPLRVVDLVLDVDTTVLNLIGTFCPEAVVITEPLIIVLSIIRMAIDDFYIDIMEEMDKVNWKSPWAGFEFIGALVKGIAEGATDFLSGGLRRQMESYRKQEEADKKLTTNLQNAESYYKIRGTKNEKVIDFTEGKLSSFGGYINFQLGDNGWAHIEIGDVTGNHKTVRKTFKIDKNVKDIVLGIGESRKFLYEKKTAKLWFVIPIKHYNLINSAKLKPESLHGTYYGNNANNKFYAVQGQHSAEKNDHRQHDYGKIDLKFVTGHYHYNLYGRGGNDVFYLGPQMSHVTGGPGSDVYIVQSYGGNTIIDNFAEDNKRDMVIVNVVFREISCQQNGVDLDVLYKKTHHIRINNWFAPGNSNYYRHVSFRSLDGIIFVPKVAHSNQVKCRAVAIDKSSQKAAQNISLQTSEYAEVKQVVGSNYSDIIIGNDLNNILDGGRKGDSLKGGRNEDTYILRAHEGCDTINNFAEDYKTTTDVIIFEIPYERIKLKSNGNNLFVYDNNNQQTSCFTILNWFLGDRFQHVILTSSDHIVFKIKANDKNHEKFPLVLDYSSSTVGQRVSLQPGQHGYQPGFEKVATVSDSKFDDSIKGNNQSNFLSCTGGKDSLEGSGGSDNYVVKKSCKLAIINNFDLKENVDLLLLDEDYANLNIIKKGNQLEINSIFKQPNIRLHNWFESSHYRHLWIRSKDGITLKIDESHIALVPVEISKDPVECQCKRADCPRDIVKYDLNKDPWKKVTRFQLNSSYCSYIIKGNNLNNYIDPGSGNEYYYQQLEGGQGVDTYVLKHGYGEFNIINNFANDNQTDILKFGLEISDIAIYFHGKYDVILASKSRPKSLSVRIMKYFRNYKYQHLQIITTDMATFKIQRQYPFMKIISLDLSLMDESQIITPEEMFLASKAQSVKGSRTHPNIIQGSKQSKEIDGGTKHDLISGGPGNNIINGWQGRDELFGKGGDDIIFGGDGDDVIHGGVGNDYIYAGNGADKINGGPGSDTLAFKGDGFEKKGVYVDLSGGFGKKADAEGDEYENIEHVYGTIHSDNLIGSNSNNNIYGQDGDDIIIAHGGNDKLVGGEGSDRYILDNAYGIKVIDNHADDKAIDTLTMTQINSTDICPFLFGEDLYLQVRNVSFPLLLYTKSDLTVVVQNWKSHSKYRHLDIVFRDKIWPSFALAQVTHKLRQIGPVAQQIAMYSKFAFASQSPNVSLSWAPIASSRLDEETRLFLMQMDIKSSKNMTITEVGDRGRILLPSLNKRKYYVFALFLKYCLATIATSRSLIYYGEQRTCPAITIQNSQVLYTPSNSLSHGTMANITCNQGYKIGGETGIYSGFCLDGQWQPSLPICEKIKRCPKFMGPINGWTHFLTRAKNRVARYMCDEGYKLNGTLERYCKDNGKWSTLDQKPQCLPLRCVELQTTESSYFTPCKALKYDSGTMMQPLHGYCAKMACKRFYIEDYKFNSLSKNYELQKKLGRKVNGKWFCMDGKWTGIGSRKCTPEVRLYKPKKTWYSVFGRVKSWNNGRKKWIDIHYPPEGKTDLACSNVFKNYDEKPVAYFELNNLVYAQCPKVRFVEKITKYKGNLEIFINQRWQPLCLEYDAWHRANKQSLITTLCQSMLGRSITFRPSIVHQKNGPTNYALICTNVKKLDYCRVKAYYKADCQHMLQCKGKCSKKYPVPNGFASCPPEGTFDGDYCQVMCKKNFRVVGDSKIFCKDGAWVKTMSGQEKATSRCESYR